MANSTSTRRRPPSSPSFAVVLIVIAASVFSKPSAVAASRLLGGRTPIASTFATRRGTNNDMSISHRRYGGRSRGGHRSGRLHSAFVDPTSTSGACKGIAGAINAFARKSPYAAAFLSCALNGAAADWLAQSSERRAVKMNAAASDGATMATELARGGQHSHHVVSEEESSSDHELTDDDLAEIYNGTETPSESRMPSTTAVVPANRTRPPRHDFRRTAAFLLYGGCYQGASLHYIYNDLFAKIFGPGGTNALAKTAASQLIMAPLLTLPVAYVFRGMVSGDTLGESLEEYRVGLMERGLLFKFWRMWMPVQFLVFTVIPVHLRVPFSSLFSFIWTVVLSRVANS